MSKSILILGESGNGKTTSLRNLPSNETYYIDADGKGLNWKGWRNQYNAENKNYFKSNDANNILTVMQGVSIKRLDVKYLVIDTLNSLMVADEMRRSKEKGFDKWVDLASSIYDIVNMANNLRDDLWVICLAHSQTDVDDFGNKFTRMKTNGKKLDKICVESFFTNVLLAKEKDGQYVFETKANNSTAKTPLGAFDNATEIDNDVMNVIKELEEF